LRHAQRLLRALVLAGVAVAVVAPGSTAIASPSPSSIEKQIDQANNELEGIVEQYNGLNDKLKDNQAAETKLVTDMKPTLVAAQAAEAGLANIASLVYIAGPADPLSAIISSNSTDGLLDQMATLGQMASDRQKQIDTYRSAVAAYDNQKQQLDSLIAAQKLEKSQLAAKKATINQKLTKLYTMRVEAYGSPNAPLPTSVPSPPSIPGRGGVIVKFAYKQLGKPYVFAAAGPNSFDCSGLVLAAYKQVGVNLYHTVTAQWHTAQHITRAQLAPGDLVFYESSSLHHVAIYIGGGKVIHAPHTGDHVRIADVDMMHPWGYGRIAG
jgi:cell wall-associated NlpC family hydrolase